MNKHNFKGYEGPDCACCSGETIKLEVADLTDPVFARGFDAGVLVERDRIIKLLEEEIQRLVDMAGQRDGGPAWRSAGIENCERTIALIKGENK
jgi:hypothetical protein